MRNPQTLCIPQRKPRADAIACYGRHGHKAPFGIGYPDLVCGKQLPRTRYDRIVGPVVEYAKANPRWNISVQAHKFMRIP